MIKNIIEKYFTKILQQPKNVQILQIVNVYAIQELPNSDKIIFIKHLNHLTDDEMIDQLLEFHWSEAEKQIDSVNNNGQVYQMQTRSLSSMPELQLNFIFYAQNMHPPKFLKQLMKNK